MVLTTIGHADGCFTDSTTTTEHSANARKEVKDTRSNQEYDIHAPQSISVPLKHKEFQYELQTSCILQSWSQGTRKHRTSNSGLSIVIGNMSVVLVHLFPKG